MVLGKTIKNSTIKVNLDFEQTNTGFCFENFSNVGKTPLYVSRTTNNGFIGKLSPVIVFCI